MYIYLTKTIMGKEMAEDNSNNIQCKLFVHYHDEDVVRDCKTLAEAFGVLGDIKYRKFNEEKKFPGYVAITTADEKEEVIMTMLYTAPEWKDDLQICTIDELEELQEMNKDLAWDVHVIGEDEIINSYLLNK